MITQLIEQVAHDFTSFTFWYETSGLKQITKQRNGHCLLVLFYSFVIVPLIIVLVTFCLIIFFGYVYFPGMFVSIPLPCNIMRNNKYVGYKWIATILSVLNAISHSIFLVHIGLIFYDTVYILCYMILYSIAGLIVNKDVVVPVLLVIVIALYYVFSPFLQIQSDYNILKEQVFKVIEEYTDGKRNRCPLSRSNMEEKLLDQASSHGYPPSTDEACCYYSIIQFIGRDRSAECNIDLNFVSEGSVQTTATESSHGSLIDVSNSGDYDRSSLVSLELHSETLSGTSSDSERDTGCGMDSDNQSIISVQTTETELSQSDVTPPGNSPQHGSQDILELYSETLNGTFDRIPKPLWDYVCNEFLFLPQKKLNAVFTMLLSILSFALIRVIVSEFDQGNDFKSLTETLMRALPLLFQKLVQIVATASYTSPGTPMGDWNRNSQIKKKVVSFIEECKVVENEQDGEYGTGTTFDDYSPSLRGSSDSSLYFSTNSIA